MLFNSIEFALFLPLVFLLYWFVFQRSLRLQNVFVVVVSYVFYGWWDRTFLLLIALTSFCSWLSGVWMGEAGADAPIAVVRRRRLIMTANIVLNLGILGFFKYYDFFVSSFIEAFSFTGLNLHASTLKIILPVGISFYTFQALSYSIDVYRGSIRPTRDIVEFTAFVSFFPQLVAGPIERATNLLPQFQISRTFNYPQAVDGCRQILWGFFKKMVIADNCAIVVNQIFGHHDFHPWFVLLYGAVLFAFQIYGDFSGYSDIASGTARLFGFSLMRNFATPYFSRDIAEFWRRWHISLSTWFRDYVYIPLGGSRCNRWKQFRNVLILFAISGLWHGANWTFVIWGILNACFFLPILWAGKNRVHTDIVAQGHILPSCKEVFLMATTFLLTVFAWVFFRAESLTHALNYLGRMFNLYQNTLSRPWPASYYCPNWLLVIMIGLLMLTEWLQREKPHALHFSAGAMAAPARYAIYYAVAGVIIAFSASQQTFIYFQF